MIVDGWLDWATRVQGPVEKVYTQANDGSGIVCHSMEGGYTGSLGELMNPARQASWMFSNAVDGRFIQHYPITASPWASGNARANTSLWSVESEGKAGTPLNDKQVANMLRLCREWEAYRVDKPSPKTANRHEGSVRSVWEHREVATWITPNAGPTACPSGRYDGFFAQLDARAPTEVEVTRKEYEDLVLALFAGSEERALDGSTLPRADRLKNALWRIQQRAEGTEQSIGSLAGSKAAALTVPAHRHDMQIAVASTGGVIK